MCGHLGGSVLGSSGLHPLPTQVCLFASCITVLFLWGHSLTLHNTLPMGPRVANKGTLVSLAHFLICSSAAQLQGLPQGKQTPPLGG